MLFIVVVVVAVCVHPKVAQLCKKVLSGGHKFSARANACKPTIHTTITLAIRMPFATQIEKAI